MHHQKPVTKSFTFNPETDSDIGGYLERPEISISAAVRYGIRLAIAEAEGKTAFEAKAIGLLEQIIGALSAGVAIEAPQTDKYDDPFLDTSL